MTAEARAQLDAAELFDAAGRMLAEEIETDSDTLIAVLDYARSAADRLAAVEAERDAASKEHAEPRARSLAALRAVGGGQTYEFVPEHGFAGEFMLYVLSGHRLTNYGTSPRGGWPDESIADLWPALIEKWERYSAIVWSETTP